MSNLSVRLALGLSVLSAIGLYSLSTASPASAFTLKNGSVTVNASDKNQSFDIFFDGNVDTSSVSGLSSKATFTFLGFSTVGSNTEASFKVSLSNTSSNGIFSRTSALGFDIDQMLLGVGNSNKVGNTRVSELFSNDREGAFPNQFGDVDVCFTNGNTCQGGQNGGVTTGKSGDFLPILAFSGKVNTFTLSNFGVRYQSIDGKSIDGRSFNGDSGTGRGTSTAPLVTSPVVVVPPPVEPIPALPVVVEPIPTPPVVVEPIPALPVAVEPIPTPPVIVEPIPALPVAVEPVPTPPVIAEPTPPLPVVVEPIPATGGAAEPSPSSTPQSVPEPGTIGGLVIVGLALLRRGK
jgi:hypothetical protein